MIHRTLPGALATRRTVRAGVVVLCLLGVASCARVPEEAVTLSVTVGRDLEEVHRSHRALAERYFGRMKVDINAFIDTKYQPDLIEKTLNAGIMDTIVTEAKKPGGGRVLPFMTRTVNKITDQVARYRRTLLEPIEAQERDVLRAIDDVYTRIQNAQAVVTGHLASVRKVELAQEEVLGAVGLKDVRSKFIDTTAEVSDRIAEITGKVERGGQKLDDAAQKLCELVKKARGTISGKKPDEAAITADCKAAVAGQ